ncbi:MAG: DNA mismatch repair endonuclease MutL [Bacteroides sp.]|nr:DNA mismatch repair endonuclease MutL [Bacteroides sp.]
MSDVIRLLPDSVANQIAAGEVIQRPASVIKELVENAVDAGATDIRIYLKDAGRTLIQVVDNGCGMSETDARMAFERHATSKITRADDLFRLRTMGFRGEALPSICAISQVEIKTRVKDAQMGTRLLINGSKVELQEVCVCEQGTSISVRNIFFNVPARRKFLKSDNVELSNVMREFERLALVNNRIRMSIDTGKRQLDLRAAKFHQRIHDIWKNNLKMSLLPVEVDTALVKISGYVSRPEYARRRNALQFLIVNGRNMRHPYFHKAVLSCFEGLIAADTQPCYFLKFEVDPASIDVNIHPTKNEIKFEYESEIWPLLVAGVRASLGKNAAVPLIDFSSDVVEVNPEPEGVSPTRPEVELPADYNPFDFPESADYRPDFGPNPFADTFDAPSSVAPSSAAPHSYGGSHYVASGRQSADTLGDWDRLYSDFMRRKREESDPAPDPVADSPVIPGMDLSPLPQMCMQFAQKYIITTTPDAVLVIDQHRAHVRVLYEGYLQSARMETCVSQRVMFPETLRLEPEQESALREVESDLRLLGFELVAATPDPAASPDSASASDSVSVSAPASASDSASATASASMPQTAYDSLYHIMAVPADLSGCDPKDIVLRILDSVSEDSHNYGADDRPVESLLSNMALVMARSAAIRRGRRLTPEEMEQLIADLFALPDPLYTPNGNRIYATLDESTLSRLL